MMWAQFVGVVFTMVVLVAAESSRPMIRVGLVADNHYDTFPVGEKAPWQPMPAWFAEQRKRASTTKRRYDLAKDKMLEAIDVFNRAQGTTFVVNLGDLVNNDLMWNLKPILDAFNTARAPHFSILGNHDLRAHNDRFGKNNATQEAWIRNKFGLGDNWYFSFSVLPFHFIFLDSMALDEKGSKKCEEHLAWVSVELQKAEKAGLAIVVFGHIAIGLDTNAVIGPVLKQSQHIVAAFFGHEHKGGYSKQNHVHTVILNGQIETQINAFAMMDIFEDRIELTGFGRVPTRTLPFTNTDTVAMIRETVDKWRAKSGGGAAAIESGKHNLRDVGNTPLPPSQLWAKETLETVPYLNLDIPTYRKPLLQASEPNPGETVFLTEYQTWPRRVLTAAPEDPVDLTSFRKGKPTWLTSAPSSRGGGVPVVVDSKPSDAPARPTTSPVAAVPRPTSNRPPTTVVLTQTKSTPATLEGGEPLRAALPAVVMLSFVVVGATAAFVLRRRKRGGVRVVTSAAAPLV